LILSRRMFAAAAAVLVISPAAAAPQKKAVDWTRTVAATPGGGFRMGNPQAKVKIVEYGSLTCPACRRFAVTAMTPLKAHVRTGRVSFEYRNYILNAVDIAAALVARCGGPSRFFPVADKLYATQGEWIGKVQAMPAADKARLESMADSERLKLIATAGGIQKLAAPYGIAPAQANKCLADPAALNRLETMVENGRALGVRSTPTFFVNDRQVDVHDWQTLEPHLKQSGG
jgi:protein-disulfide isomerase